MLYKRVTVIELGLMAKSRRDCLLLDIRIPQTYMNQFPYHRLPKTCFQQGTIGPHLCAEDIG